MGKKLRDKLDHMKPKFIEGGRKNRHDPKVLEKIWTDWEKFASYAFNKSHATCYSWVAYQTAYLKSELPVGIHGGCHGPKFVQHYRYHEADGRMQGNGYRDARSDVNESNLKFTVNHDGNIRFGLGAVKA